MSIADKLTTVAENQQRVYDAGFTAGQANGNGGYDKGVEDGKQAAYDNFWDIFQKKGKRLHYSYAFAFSGWTDDIYNPKYPITPTNSNGLSSMFLWNYNITDTKVPITAYAACQNAFSNTMIRRIPKLIFNGATNVSNMFANCTELEELYCEGELTLSLSLADCTKLTRESIESVVNVLSSKFTKGEATSYDINEVRDSVGDYYPPQTVEGYDIYPWNGGYVCIADGVVYEAVPNVTGQTLTLSKTAVEAAFEEWEWIYVLQSKPNWTITLV